MRHQKFDEVRTLIEHDIAVLVTGEKGSGKTTLIQQVAKELDLEFVSMSMTRQTTLSHLLGFKNVDGVYIESLLRRVCENGGLFLLDEIDASDPNVLLCLNTIENGFISFPDKVVECHPDFRIAATANPQDQHAVYTGRAKLDASTLDRFDIVPVETDPNLEKSLVGPQVLAEISLLRNILKEQGSSKHVSMRDSLRYQKRKGLKLTESFMERIIGDDPLLISTFLERVKKLPSNLRQSECTSSNELWKVINEQYNQETENVQTEPTEQHATSGHPAE